MTPSVRLFTTLPFAIAVLWACDDGGVAPAGQARQVERIALSAPAVSMSDGDTLRLYANLLDQHGAVIGDGSVGVEWSSANPAVVAVTSEGALTALRPGITRVTASAGDGVSQDVPVTVHARVSSLRVTGGQAQQGYPSYPLNDSISVRALDRRGVGVPDVEIRFHPAGGGASVSPGLAVTDAQGIARTQWTLGSAIGTHHMEARAPGTVAPAAVEASVASVLLARVTAPDSASVGGALPASVRLDSAPFGRAIGGALVVLRWDPTRLRLDPSSIAGGGSGRLAYRLDDAGGALHLASTDPLSTSGEGVLASFVLDVVGGSGGVADLELEIVQLVDAAYGDVAAAALVTPARVMVR